MSEQPPPKIQIDGLRDALEPIEYRENWEEDNGLAIHARVDLFRGVGDDLRRLWVETRAADQYFGVTRVGIDAEPREMRFGMPSWSQHGDREKHHVVLVDSANDEGKQMRLPAPEEQKERAQVLRTAEQMDMLLDLLVERGKLSQQDVDRVRDVSNERMWERLLELHRVDDLDDWE